MKTTIEIETDNTKCKFKDIDKGDFFECGRWHLYKIDGGGINFITDEYVRLNDNCLVRPAFATFTV